ncbi:uncharacterized protein LOC133393391 [Anopheles gambiae]|uniref:uncharacterized protein LOC133393391 n=1 Tax=Anopheles gambiae TaxID=7165 RepID=UPI002AC8AD99|nr:uncharacterized protein LOC133393391 [Anopheles gambiae]
MIQPLPLLVRQKKTTFLKFATTDAAARATIDREMIRSHKVNPNSALEERIRQLELEKNLLLLQKEMAELKATTAGGTSADVNALAPARDVFECVAGMVAPSSGDKSESITPWFEELEKATGILQLHDISMLIVTRRLLVGTAAIFAKTVHASSYVELKVKLTAAFGKGPSLECVYAELRRRRLLPTETTFRYVLEMEKIAKKGAVPKEELITIIIDKMGDASNTSGMRYAANTLEDLKKLLGKYEQLRMLKAPPSTRASPRQPVGSLEASETRCFNCSAFGHYRDKCPKPPRTPGACFHCHQRNHTYKDCPERNNTSTAAVFTTDRDSVVTLQETQEEVQHASLMNHWSQNPV